MVLGGEHVADDGDEELRERLAVEEEGDGAAHGVGLGGAIAGLELRLDLIRHRRRALVEVHQEEVAARSPRPRHSTPRRALAGFCVGSVGDRIFCIAPSKYCR